MTVRCAIYARISSDDGSALGVARQVEDCRREVKRRGWDVAEVYTDNDVSASKAKVRRPAYERMLSDVQEGRVDAIAVWDVDRLTRTPRELEDIISFADEHHLRLASVGGEIDLGTEQGRLTARLKGSVARYEVEQSARRLRRKHDELAQAGSPNGPRAFGYTRTHVDNGRGNLVPVDVVNPEEAAIIREATARVLEGDGLWKIVKDLNARGIVTPRGGLWQTQTLRRMLLKPRNAGLRVHRGKVVGEAAWEPIVDRETFDRLTAKLTDPARRTNNRGTEVRYLLTGIAECGKCNRPVVGRAEFHYSYRSFPNTYACPHTGCMGISRRMALVDAKVEGVVVGILVRDGVRLFGGDPERAKAATARIEALEAKLAVAADEWSADLITTEQLNRITARLRPQIAEERRNRDAAQPAPHLAKFAGPCAPDAWAVASVEERRLILAILQELGMHVTIRVIGPGRRATADDIDVWWEKDEEAE